MTWDQPVGSGEVYLPDRASRVAYGAACRAAIIDSAARHTLRLPTLAARQAFIKAYPDRLKEALKVRIKQLWETKNEQPNLDV